MLPGYRSIALTKTVEDEREKLRRNALSRVSDDDAGSRTNSIDLDLYCPALRRKFHSIRQQIPNHLLKASSIPVDIYGKRIKCTTECDHLGVCRGTHRIHCRIDNRKQVHALGFNCQLAGNDTR